MNARTFTLIGAGLVVAKALGIAWHNAHLNRTANAAAAGIAAKQAITLVGIRRLEDRLAAAEKACAAQQSTLDALKKQSSAATTGTTPQKPGPNTRLPSIADRLRHEPDAQVLWLAYHRSRAGERYGPLFQALRLSPEQIAKFQDNLIRREEQNMDLQAIVASQKESTGRISAELYEMMKKIEPDHQAAQRELLGEAGYRQLLDHERTVRVRDMVNGWAGDAVVSARTPFTAQQGEQLVQILANASSSYRDGGSADSTNIDWDVADAQARAILSDPQLNLFKTMEPPLPSGARFQSQFYRLVNEAQAADAKVATSTAKAPGG